MSNILTPIVAKYSLFFTLTMCSSSSISRSKQPTHLVQTLLLEAQQRYQDKSTEKLRALIRHLSTTSTSSSSLSQSAASQLTSGSTEISSPSSFQPVDSSSSSSSRIEPPSSSHLPLDEDIPSLPPVKEVTKSSVVAHNKSSEHHHIKDNDSNTNTNNSNNNSNNKTKSATLVSILDTKEQDHPNHNHSNSSNSNSNGDNNHNHNSSPPCLLSPLGEAATATAAVDATVSSDRLDQKQASTLPSPSPSISVSSTSVATVHTKLHQQLQQQLTTTRRDQQGSSKVNKSSIAALLSVTLTMILLSLLQSKKRHIRRKGRSPRGTTSKRNSRGGRQLLQLHRDGYKSAGTDQFTHRSHSPSSSYTHLLLTDSNNNNMEGTSSEGARSLLTQYRPVSFFGGHGGEPTAALHIPQHHLSSLPTSTHGLVLSDNNNNSTLPPSNTLHYESTTPLPHQGNMYSGRDLGYSLSDCSLPDKRSKRDLVADWLDQQTFVDPEMAESLESLPLAQDGPSTHGHDNDPLQQFLPPQYYQQQHQQQQQQSTLPRQQGFPAQLDPNQLYLQQHSINNTGAQREPRQEHRRAIQRSNDLYPGSRTSLYHSHSTKRHSMVALDQQPQHQPNPRLSQPQLQQQQLSSSSSFWRDAPSQPQYQPQSQQQPLTPHQYRPPYPHYPQQHNSHPQQHNLPQYAHYQQQYQQPTSSPSFRPPTYESYGYDDPDQQDPNHRRSLSLNNSGGRGGVRSRPQSQVYRKATPARFENLSLVEQARQEHQMRRQHYQQHYHQHRQQQHQQHQHQYQHQQYYQAPGSRPESMYSNGPAAPRAHTMGSTSPREVSQFVPPRHHHQQSHPATHPPPQQQQHHHNPSVSSPKGSNVSRSANDLAWERHCYYQQQQIQEDALAERKRIDQQQQHQRKVQRPLSSVEGLQVPLLQESSSLMRTSSMSRISNSSTTAVAGGNASSSLRRRVDSATVALQNPSSGLSRSVSTSAILEAKQRAANKDKVNSANLKKNKESPADETETKSTSMFDDCKFLRLLRRSDSKLAKSATAVEATMTEADTESPSTSASSKKQSKVPAIVTIQPVDSIPSPPPAATTGLNRRKTLKDLGPSIRSLARRCSSRFSNNSSRPNSFAGSSSDPVIQFSEGKRASGAASGGVRGSHSFSMATSYLPLKMSLSSLPRSLAPGPDGMVDLQQAAEPHVQQSTPSSGTPSLSLTGMPALALLPSTPEKEQRVPIHRKVTLFRSKTISLAKSSSSSSSRAKTTTSGTHTADTIDTTPVSTANAVADDDNNANTKNSARANSFPSRRRPQRDSLRLANGHGLDFNTFLPPITVTTSFSTISAGTSSSSVAADDEQASAVERSTNDLESALPGRSTLVPVPAAIVTGSRLSDEDQQQKARRQIISLLAMGRKGRISAKTGQAMKSGSSSSSQPSTPTTASSPTTPISQLSPLALEAQEDLFVGGTAGGAKKEGEEDPVERIAFMLVPKSRYEFQPLVVA